MHFKTLVFAAIASLSAVAALPSGSAHDAHVVARHHRFIRPRKPAPEPTSTGKRCSATTTSTAAPEETDVEVGNLAAKPTTTKTKSAKFTSTASETDSETDAPAPTAGTGGISINDKLLAIFPDGLGTTNWSTDPAVKGAMALTTDAIGATSIMARIRPSIETFNGKKAMKVNFSRGSYAYRSKALGGVSMYALGPSSKRIDNAKSFTMSYSVQFSKGFQFNKGGKLPGSYGGTSDTEARGCSGGNTRPTCWSVRYMWREGGKGELYAYLPSDAKATNKARLCNGGKNTSCDLGYGWSLGRGTWDWTPGSWQRIAQKVTLNDVGKANGSVITYVDGKEVFSATNIILRTRKNAMPRGAMIQSFFGGHGPEWASPQDQQVYFADFSVAVLETE